MTDAEDTDFAGFKGALDLCTSGMTEQQKLLLNSIVKLAWIASKDDETHIAEFDGSFTPEQADLLLQYDPAPGPAMTAHLRFIR
ncbi:hypothetical protein ABZ342_13575 [Amycolatopsis sp. NPDC005961]|uniref:hypothetical protein n=1 Tax=Amycolatopsis sp. NPDC005961 TaxID=3156720 RepID=UPI00340714E7